MLHQLALDLGDNPEDNQEKQEERVEQTFVQISIYDLDDSLKSA